MGPLQADPKPRRSVPKGRFLCRADGAYRANRRSSPRNGLALRPIRLRPADRRLRHKVRVIGRDPSLDLVLEFLGLLKQLRSLAVTHDVCYVVIERVPLPAAQLEVRNKL